MTIDPESICRKGVCCAFARIERSDARNWISTCSIITGRWIHEKIVLVEAVYNAAAVMERVFNVIAKPQ